MNKQLVRQYTVESVTEGHPDKVCDQISDAILDACLREDPYSRVAIETFGAHGTLVIGGELTTRAEICLADIARQVYRDIGYTDHIEIIERVERQSPDIALGVDTGGAGDQGIMYGYATDETPEMLPTGIVLAHALSHRLARLRKETTDGARILRPDGKTQVTFRYLEKGVPQLDVLVSSQHGADVEQDEVRAYIDREVIRPTLARYGYVASNIRINPTGRFVIGGFEGDTGLTGRKIMVDTYGGLVPHGGGAFSGKDATKVDRSAAYMARFAARRMVEEGFGREVRVAVAYAIGVADSVMLFAENEDGMDLSLEVARRFDFRPAAIIERLGLRRPIFYETARNGHFGHDEFPWEERLRKEPRG
jgi:S-adenosylmethionine synthetase